MIQNGGCMVGTVIKLVFICWFHGTFTQTLRSINQNLFREKKKKSYRHHLYFWSNYARIL